MVVNPSSTGSVNFVVNGVLADKTGQKRAVWVQIAYLINLMLLPVLAYLVLVAMWWQHRRGDSALLRAHVWHTFFIATVGGLVLFAVLGGFAVFGDLDDGSTWVGLILGFVIIHTGLILLGVLGLVRAFSGQLPFWVPSFARVNVIGGAGGSRR